VNKFQANNFGETVTVFTYCNTEIIPPGSMGEGFNRYIDRGPESQEGACESLTAS